MGSNTTQAVWPALRGCILRKMVNMGRGLRAREVEGSLWTSVLPRIVAAVTLARATMSQERGDDLEFGE